MIWSSKYLRLILILSRFCAFNEANENKTSPAIFAGDFFEATVVWLDWILAEEVVIVVFVLDVVIGRHKVDAL